MICNVKSKNLNVLLLLDSAQHGSKKFGADDKLPKLRLVRMPFDFDKSVLSSTRVAYFSMPYTF